MAIKLPTVDELYLRSQAEVVNLKLKIDELNERIESMGNNWVRLDIEHDEELAKKQAIIEAWKKMYFEAAQSLQFSTEGQQFWADCWEHDTSVLEKKIRRLKKKAKKK